MAKMLETLGCCADFAPDGEEVLFLAVLASLFFTILKHSCFLSLLFSRQ
jgi:hypothetical protein